MLGIGLYGSVYLMPLFLGRVRGYDSLQIGETMFVTGAVHVRLGADRGPACARRWICALMLAIGLVMFGGGLWWMAHLTKDSAFWELFGPQALRGFSMMFVMLPVNQIALGTAAAVGGRRTRRACTT